MIEEHCHVGALCIDGLLVYSIQEGSMNTDDYENFIEHVLYLQDICNEKGVILEFLPAYSLDFNPIEQTFFYIKNYLRQNKIWAESMQDPLDILDFSCITIEKKLAYACYQHGGYIL
ncbi:11538_t:CDS:2 [Dentiscutata heterogama]|uniref:11538_t:CDS:1 n=1 Tax=Dentiscutata heterogama TaxID=1316150 RepID=A0ACA9JVG2_9GLOM|nr:11538_t:CDS:2 [Dentiscutata heterogama]